MDSQRGIKQWVPSNGVMGVKEVDLRVQLWASIYLAGDGLQEPGLTLSGMRLQSY